MVPSNWQILTGLERPKKLLSVEQLLQVCHCTSVLRGNLIQKKPSDDFTIVSEELFVIDVEMVMVVMNQNILMSQWMPLQLRLNISQLHNLRESQCQQLLASVPEGDSQNFQELEGVLWSIHYMPSEAVFDYTQSHDNHLAL